MFSPLGCRRGFPREPCPWQAGRPPPHLYARDEPPWEMQPCRGRGRQNLRCPRDPRPFPAHKNFQWNEDNGNWAPPPPWDEREDCFKDGSWAPPPPWDDQEDCFEDRSWAAPPPWDERGDYFRDDMYPDPGPNYFDFELGNEEQYPPWPPAELPRERGGFQRGCPSRGYPGVGGRRCRRFRRGRRELTVVRRVSCPKPSKGKQPSLRSSSPPGTSQPRVKEEPQSPDPPQPFVSCTDDIQSREQTAQIGLLAARGDILESPKLTGSPQKSLADDFQAVPEAVKLEQAGGATSVELGARQELTNSYSQSPSALETEPAPLEKSSAGRGEHLEAALPTLSVDLMTHLECLAQVELCSQSTPKAGAGGSHPHGATAAPEPAKRVHATPSSPGEMGAELCPCPWGQRHLPSGAGGAEGEAAHRGLLSGLQPPETSQVPPGATEEPNAQPRQACSSICTETSPGTQHPPGSGDWEPAAGGRPQLSPTLPALSPRSSDLRSAAVLARKEEIELSYQQFSLSIAVVATMLLQKEPSMEAPLGLALRANLRQGRIHHLRELEDFINSYDSATLSR